MKVKSHFFIPGQMVVNRGDIGQQLWYLDHGTLEVSKANTNLVVARERAIKLVTK